MDAASSKTASFDLMFTQKTLDFVNFDAGSNAESMLVQMLDQWMCCIGKEIQKKLWISFDDNDLRDFNAKVKGRGFPHPARFGWPEKLSGKEICPRDPNVLVC
jgi:hypothetical protein